MNFIRIGARRRIAAGFVVAPLVVPVAYLVAALKAGSYRGGSEILGTLIVYGTYAYLFALVLGVPAFLLLRRSGRLALWSCTLLAGAIGLMGSGAMHFIGLKPEGIAIGVLSGLLSGAVFYLVALY